jgi:uncharacterized protein (DUF1684 family)
MFVLLTFVALVTALAAPQTDYRSALEKHRKERLAELTADDGWLTVAGLFWLEPGANVAGSAPGSPVLLPASAPARLGVFELKDGRVIFTADPAARVTRAGAPVSTIELSSPKTPADDPQPPVMLESGDLRLFAIRREDRVAIRMRDLKSAMRQGFKGLEYFPLEPAYRVRATFVAYKEPKKIPIPNVLGQVPEMVSPGYVTFTLDGRDLRLEPVYETREQKDLFFIFKDETSRDATYPAGRFLHAPLPVDGVVDLDFNKAYNPPCAFTDFATCPLPPKQNRLAIRIEAGERAYHGPTK